MDNSAIFVGMFIFNTFINAVLVIILYVLSKDITDLHKFIMEFLDTMIDFENEKIEIMRNKEEKQ